MHLNGQLTLGENTADNGGVRMAYMALEDTLKGTGAAATRRLHPRAALLPGLGAGLVRERDRAERQAARADRSALAGPLPRQRRRRQHAGVPAGLQLRAEAPDGARERLPGLVRF